jgi:hypothetical protein
MGRHADTVSTLVRSVILLDRPTIRTLATRIADEEAIGRATSDPQAKRPPLPRGFVVEQGELSLVARQLAAAAAEGDDAALADRFSALTRTCVSCHSAYLHGRPDVQPLQPQGKSQPPRP